MLPRISSLVALILVIFTLFSPSIVSASTPYALNNTPTAIPRQLCTALIGPTGIYSDGRGAVFVEGVSNGNIYYCSKNYNDTLVATPPQGGSTDGYIGMGGVNTAKYGIVLVLTTVNGGMWFCYGATRKGCASESLFIPFPSKYCSSLPHRVCDPYGTVIDGNLNVYWVDSENSVFSECTHASNYARCMTLPASAELKGQYTMGLALWRGTFYVTSYSSCTGEVWAGSPRGLALIATIDDQIEAVGVSNRNSGNVPEVYVGDTAACHGGQPAKLIDISDNGTVPTGAIGYEDILGISSGLQFSNTDFGEIIQTSDGT